MSIERPSAKIFQFPVQPGARRNLERLNALQAMEIECLRRPMVTTGGWYHDEAVREAERSNKR